MWGRNAALRSRKWVAALGAILATTVAAAAIASGQPQAWLIAPLLPLGLLCLYVIFAWKTPTSQPPPRRTPRRKKKPIEARSTEERKWYGGGGFPDD